MSILTILFWYLAIGALCYVRMSYRIKPYEEKLVDSFEKNVNYFPFNSTVGVYLTLIVSTILMWPALLLKPRVLFSNGKLFKDGWDKEI